MPDNIPTWIYPFILAVVAVIAGRVLGGPAREDPESLPRVMLYAVGAGCAVIGFVLLWLAHAG